MYQVRCLHTHRSHQEQIPRLLCHDDMQVILTGEALKGRLLSLVPTPGDLSLSFPLAGFHRLSHYEQILEASQVKVEAQGAVVPDTRV
jgi:hypothetical protein